MTEHETMAGPSAPDVDEMRAAMGRAAGGDPAALARLRALLDETGLWRRLGDLAAHAELSWLGHVAAGDAAMREVLARKLAELKAEFCGRAPTPLERLLVDRVAAAWLRAHHADLRAVAAEAGDPKRAGPTLKRQAQAQRQYAAAITALATVRRLLPPPPASEGIRKAGNTAGAVSRKGRDRPKSTRRGATTRRDEVESAEVAKVALFEPAHEPRGEGK